jgi:hypothetical protein
MNKFHRKPAANPVFKLRQPLPRLAAFAAAVKAPEEPGQMRLPGHSLDKLLPPADSQLPRGGPILLCKNFAFITLV